MRLVLRDLSPLAEPLQPPARKSLPLDAASDGRPSSGLTLPAQLRCCTPESLSVRGDPRVPRAPGVA